MDFYLKKKSIKSFVFIRFFTNVLFEWPLMRFHSNFGHSNINCPIFFLNPCAQAFYYFIYYRNILYLFSLIFVDKLKETLLEIPKQTQNKISLFVSKCLTFYCFSIFLSIKTLNSSFKSSFTTRTIIAQNDAHYDRKLVIILNGRS